MFIFKPGGVWEEVFPFGAEWSRHTVLAKWPA